MPPSRTLVFFPPSLEMPPLHRLLVCKDQIPTWLTFPKRGLWRKILGAPSMAESLKAQLVKWNLWAGTQGAGGRQWDLQQRSCCNGPLCMSPSYDSQSSLQLSPTITPYGRIQSWGRAVGWPTRPDMLCCTPLAGRCDSGRR